MTTATEPRTCHRHGKKPKTFPPGYMCQHLAVEFLGISDDTLRRALQNPDECDILDPKRLHYRLTLFEEKEPDAMAENEAWVRDNHALHWKELVWSIHFSLTHPLMPWQKFAERRLDHGQSYHRATYIYLQPPWEGAKDLSARNDVPAFGYRIRRHLVRDLSACLK